MYVLYLLYGLVSNEFGALSEIRTHTVSDLNAVRLPIAPQEQVNTLV